MLKYSIIRLTVISTGFFSDRGADLSYGERLVIDVEGTIIKGYDAGGIKEAVEKKRNGDGGSSRALVVEKACGVATVATYSVSVGFRWMVLSLKFSPVPRFITRYPCA